MGDSLPMFPLGTVLFPGVDLPLHVFEDRYRALVHHLLAITEPSQRCFGVVAIREGYEVGEHGVQSAHRVGCVAELRTVEAYDDGRFDIEVVGRERLRLDHMDTSGEYLVGTVELLPEPAGDGAAAAAAEALAAFDTYRRALGVLRGDEVLTGTMPTEPVALSYALAASLLLAQSERQDLLEAPDAASRLREAVYLIRSELNSMRAVPSLPATQVARTGWSPN